VRQIKAIKCPHRIRDPVLDDLLDLLRIIGVDHRCQGCHQTCPEIDDASVWTIATDAWGVDAGTAGTTACPRGNPCTDDALFEQARLFIRDDFPGTIELLDLLLGPLPWAFIANRCVSADDRPLRRQLPFQDGHNRVPNPFGFRWATRQVVIDLDHLIESKDRIIKKRQIQFAFGDLRLVLRNEMLGILRGWSFLINRLKDLFPVV